VNKEYLDQIPDWAEIRVRWMDAYCPASGWHETSDYEARDSTATTIGRLWKNFQDDYLTVVGTIFESELPEPETIADINHIPINWIVSVEIISTSNNGEYNA
jgi:hypothetical protein